MNGVRVGYEREVGWYAWKRAKVVATSEELVMMLSGV